MWAEKKNKHVFHISHKTLAILIKFGNSFLDISAKKSCKRFTPHLSNVSKLPCETLNAPHTCYHWVVRERNSIIYSTLTVASKFDRFESSWLQHVGNIAREGVQNTHHWSGRTETATENGVGQVDRFLIAATICQWCHQRVQISDACFAHLLSQYSYTW